jgi:hypothetical protein
MNLDTRDRALLGGGALYLIVLLAVVAYAAAGFRPLAAQAAPAGSVDAGLEYRAFLRVAILGLAICLGLWTGAVAAGRRPWIGLAALGAGGFPRRCPRCATRSTDIPSRGSG